MDIGKVYEWLRDAGHGLLPPRCLVCREPAGSSLDLCDACATALPRLHHACPRCALPLPETIECGQCLQTPPPLTHAHAVFIYGFPLDRLIPRFKFHRDLAAGRLLVEWMAESMAGRPRPEALVPVPLHASRLRQRGYDQAMELARPLAHALDIPLLPDCLLRTRATAAQSALDADARRRNLKRAFHVDTRTPLPLHVALVDDVMTTGATLHAAARALQSAGVQRVDAWVCARAP